VSSTSPSWPWRCSPAATRLLGPRALDHLAKRLLGGGAAYDADQEVVRMAAERTNK
jgi:hypothetical protein